MRDIKIAVGFAIFGFLVSFISGIFSHSSFLLILLKALIFAVIFGILGIIVKFIFSKFLLDDTAELTTEQNGAEEGTQNVQNTKGRMVDLVVQDQELEETESQNSFHVGTNHQMLNESDISHEQKMSDAASNSGFVPLRKFETVENFSSTESANPNIMSAGKTNDSVSDNGDELDVLPDMSYMSENEAVENQEDDAEDSGFGSSFSTTTTKSNSDSIVGEMKDTALIAKAISSVLSQESN